MWQQQAEDWEKWAGMRKSSVAELLQLDSGGAEGGLKVDGET